ncbi:ATPase family AAA domain-containing protein 1-A, partial [Glycine soja]
MPLKNNDLGLIHRWIVMKFKHQSSRRKNWRNLRKSLEMPLSLSEDTLAYKLQLAIIFIDEVDNFLENAQVMVLAATYRPSELDEAILQHLPQAFEIGVPDQRERIEILKVVLKGERVEDNIDFGHIAGLCEGYTSLDLFDLCKKATYFPIIELLDEEKKGKRSH